MGYHLTILRTEGRKQLPIPVGEIEQAIAGLPEWKLSRDRKNLSYKAPDGFGFRLNFNAEDGELWQKGDEVLTSDRAMDLMVALAERLSARLRGDEFETYRSAQESYAHPDDAAIVRELEQQSRARRRKVKLWDVFRLVVLVVIVCFFAWRVWTGR